MNGYIVSVIAASAVVAFGSLISYGGATARISRAAMAMVLIYTITLPIFSVTDDLSDIVFTDGLDDLRVEYDMDDTLFYENTAAAFSEGVRRLVCSEYGLDSGEVTVSVRALDVELMCAEKIIVILSGRASGADARSIARTVEEAKLGECEVKIVLGK